MNTNYVHTLGDSTLDNYYWMLSNAPSDYQSSDSSDTNSLNFEVEAKKKSVEGQLAEQLSLKSSSTYKVVSHAYDGFTTSTVLNGGHVGWPRSVKSTPILYAYIKDRVVDADANSYRVNPLKQLQQSVNENQKANHYVVISVGGNDFRELLINPIRLLRFLRQVTRIQDRYLQILREVKAINTNVKPILMFQYRFDATKDPYKIYLILKIITVFSAAINSLCILGMGASFMSLVAKKISLQFGLSFFIGCGIGLGLSHSIIPLKITKDVFMGRNDGVETLGALMKFFYGPILRQAKKDRIPILDLPNTLNPYDESLFISQIEPSAKGGALIAQGISHIVQKHDFTSQSMMYSKSGSRNEFTARKNPGAFGWTIDQAYRKS